MLKISCSVAAEILKIAGRRRSFWHIYTHLICFERSHMLMLLQYWHGFSKCLLQCLCCLCCSARRFMLRPGTCFPIISSQGQNEKAISVSRGQCHTGNTSAACHSGFLAQPCLSSTAVLEDCDMQSERFADRGVQNLEFRNRFSVHECELKLNWSYLTGSWTEM